MPNYLVAIHRPHTYDASVAEDDAMFHNIDALNNEMVAACIRVFVGGLQPPDSAKSLRMQPNGELLSSNGLFLNSKEHVGGFWVLDVTDLDEALTWGRKAAIACRASVEVRPFY